MKGKNLRVLYEDDRSTTLDASSAVRKLVDRDQVVALLGEVVSIRSLAGGLIANTSRVPMVTPSSTAVEVTRDRAWVFRACFTDDQQGAAAARFAKEDLGRAKAAILYAAQDAYSSGLARSFRDAFGKRGGVIVLDRGYQEGDADFRVQLEAITQAHPDVVFLPIYFEDLVRFARQAKEAGLPSSALLGGDGWDSAELAQQAGANLEGAYFTNLYAPDLPWPSARAFREAFRARYSRDPTSLSAQGYDAARLLFDAISRAKEITRAQIRDALAQTKDFEGATGKLSMDAHHDAQRPVIVVKIADGKATFAKSLSAD